MQLRVVGAGLPRTATSSLAQALQQLLDGHCHRMSAIPGHPFDLGEAWQQALMGDSPDWNSVFEGYIAAVDWTASSFWRVVREALPDALVILSVRESAEIWWESLNATVLPVARLALADDWQQGRDLVTLFERFTGTTGWDVPSTFGQSCMEVQTRRADCDGPSRALLRAATIYVDAMKRVSSP